MEHAKPQVIDEVYGPEFGGGHSATRQFVSANLAAFPDLQITIQDQSAENDSVATCYAMRATHQGEFASFPPNGKSFTITGMEIHRFAGGKLVELWKIPDMLGRLQQLGIIQLRQEGVSYLPGNLQIHCSSYLGRGME